MTMPAPTPPEWDAHFKATHPITVADLFHIADTLREHNYPPDGAVSFRTPIADDRRAVDISVSPNPHPKEKPHENIPNA
jgi:hypothetical protein